MLRGRGGEWEWDADCESGANEQSEQHTVADPRARMVNIAHPPGKACSSVGCYKCGAPFPSVARRQRTATLRPARTSSAASRGDQRLPVLAASGRQVRRRSLIAYFSATCPLSRPQIGVKALERMRLVPRHRTGSAGPNRCWRRRRRTHLRQTRRYCNCPKDWQRSRRRATAPALR